MTTRHLTLLAVLFGIAVGAAAGLGLFTFIYAEGASYLTNDPEACMNCHIMREQYEGWTKSSHHAVAVCNDCHTPHNFFGKYMTKGLNGYHHSWAFTFGGFHEPIQITPRNHRITEDACRYCHEPIVLAIDRHNPRGHGGDPDALSCVRCHPSVGHMH